MRWFFAKSELEVSVVGVFLARIFPAFFPIRNEYGEILHIIKNADQINSDYGLFLRSENLKGTENASFSIKIYPKSLVYLGLSQTFTIELFAKSFCKILLPTSVYANVFFTTLHLCTENEVSH